MRASLVLTIVVMVAVCCVHARPNRYEQVSKRTQKETNLLEELRELLNTSPKKSTDKSEHSVARKQLSHMSKKSASKRQYAYGYGCSVANCKHCDYYYRVCAMCRYGYVLRDGVCEGGAGNVEQGQYTTASPDENPNSPDPYDYTDRSEQTTASSYDSWNRNEDTTTHPYENDVTSQDDSSSYVYGCARMAELYGPRGEIDITASQYKNNMRCHWRITVNVGERVHLHFKNFDVENATRDECTFDSVKVYDGKSMKSPLLNTFCGSDVPGEMTSTGNTLLISFLTDSSETRDGFSVEYRERDRGAPQCGFPDKFPVYPGIKGGSAAQPHSWPWQASLQYRDIHFCGATIISKRWLITSQHCLVSRSLSGITVVVGDHCRGQQEYNRRIHDADGFYNRSANVGIGLIRLKEPIEFNRDVSQLCLPKKTAKVRTMCMTTGWGTRRDNSSMCLNQVSLKLTEGYNCDRMSGDEAYLCADYNYEGKNECQGDEGGPLVCKSEEMGVWNLQGIHIRQKDNCAGKKTHTLFQEITSSLEWIERTVSDNGGW